MSNILWLRDKIDGDKNFYATTRYFDETPLNFWFIAGIDDEHLLANQLSKKDELLSSIENYDFSNDESKRCRVINAIKNSSDEFLDLFDIVEISCVSIDLERIIKEIPNIQNKKIIIDIPIEISDYDKLKQLLEQFEEYKDNIFIKSEKPIPISDFLTAMNVISEAKDKILSLDLSPMEKTMYIYDMVRNRLYNMESEEDDHTISRDLYQVLIGEYIVCSGFANIFNKMLNEVGIKSQIVILDSKDKTPGHARVYAYIYDEKYGIDGAYYFDPTWDCKNENNSNEFLSRYKYFALTRDEIIKLDGDMFRWHYSKKSYEDIKKLIKEKSWVLLSSGALLLRLGIDDALERIDKILYSDVGSQKAADELLRELDDIEEKFNRPIPAETFVTLLNNVRKVQFYENPEFYPYTLYDFYITFCNSNWCFQHENQGDGISINSSNPSMPSMTQFIEFANEGGIGKEIEGVRLTKVLQKVRDKKSQTI